MTIHDCWANVYDKSNLSFIDSSEAAQLLMVDFSEAFDKLPLSSQLYCQCLNFAALEFFGFLPNSIVGSNVSGRTVCSQFSIQWPPLSLTHTFSLNFQIYRQFLNAIASRYRSRWKLQNCFFRHPRIHLNAFNHNRTLTFLVILQKRPALVKMKIRNCSCHNAKASWWTMGCDKRLGDEFQWHQGAADYYRSASAEIRKL